MAYIALGAVAAVAIVGSCTALMSANVVDEGHIGIVTEFGEAQRQIGPGLTLVNPFTQNVVEIEVRERRTTEDLAASTANQLPITATISANWTVSAEAGMDLYRKYGGLAQFDDRIFGPNLRQAAKEGLARFQADELIRNRGDAANTIVEIMREELAGYPLSVTSLQIENVILPQAYLDAVMEKERARENAARERFTLDQQKLQAQQAVQTAEAERDANKARADGEAYATRTQATAQAEKVRELARAEADGLQVIADALAKNPALIDFERAKRWNGAMPSTVIGGDASPAFLMELPR